MRLKAAPDDFVVREATDLRIRRDPAPFRVYILEKIGWNTTDALMRIASDKRVSYSRFAYGGKKDRHAHTFQYVTVEHRADLSLSAKGYSFKALGYSSEPMAPSRILSNRFELTVRELSAAEGERLAARAEPLKEHGVPNYFDDQRFGNMDPQRGFIAEKLIQGRWEEALDMALTSIHSEEKREAKERKRAIRAAWGDWAACAALARTAFEQRAFTRLQEQPGAFREALATINGETAGLWTAAYQSFLWNEVMRRLLERRGWAGPSWRGPAGRYVFLAPEAAAEAVAALHGLMIPLPGRRMRMDLPEAADLLEVILAERRLRPAALEQELLPGLALFSSLRPALSVPQSFWLEGPAPDERYPGHSKALLRFMLNRGAYATMVVKGLLVPPTPPGRSE